VLRGGDLEGLRVVWAVAGGGDFLEFSKRELALMTLKRANPLQIPIYYEREWLLREILKPGSSTAEYDSFNKGSIL